MSYVRFPNFPNSYHSPFFQTSQQTTTYNCIAWAFGDNTKWYWPDPDDIYYWPSGIPREITVDAFIELFESVGYEVCTDGNLEQDLEKIVIFADSNGLPTHAARQLKDGNWTSKLGMHIDVSHSIDSMEGGAYGTAVVYMSRVFTL